LDVPAKHDLCRGLPVGLRDAEDHRVLQGAAVAAVAVERDPADRRPRLGADAVLGAECLDRPLLEVGMQLDLVDRRNDAGRVQEPGEVVDHEVADPDRPDLAVAQQALERTVGIEGLVEGRRERLVQDEQVDLVHSELAGTLLETVQGLVETVVADPDLRFDEDLVPGDARGLNRLPTSRSLPYDAAVSMCRYPTSSADATAARVSSGGVWKTPSPRAGIVTPLFRVRLFMPSTLGTPLTAHQ
jgi:hypothetical protein